MRMKDVLAAALQEMPQTLAGEVAPVAAAPSVYGRDINAPDWPWWTAGWTLSALFALFVLVAWSHS
jgi:hypothetical protein